MLHAIVNLLENSAHCIDIKVRERVLQPPSKDSYTTSDKCPALEKGLATQNE